jgi:hypothetical protein
MSLSEIEVRDNASGSVADSNATRFLPDHLSWLWNNDPVAESALTSDMITQYTPISAMNDPKFRNIAANELLRDVYNRLRN